MNNVEVVSNILQDQSVQSLQKAHGSLEENNQVQNVQSTVGLLEQCCVRLESTQSSAELVKAALEREYPSILGSISASQSDLSLQWIYLLTLAQGQQSKIALTPGLNQIHQNIVHSMNDVKVLLDLFRNDLQAFSLETVMQQLKYIQQNIDILDSMIKADTSEEPKKGFVKSNSIIRELLERKDLKNALIKIQEVEQALPKLVGPMNTLTADIRKKIFDVVTRSGHMKQHLAESLAVSSEVIDASAARIKKLQKKSVEVGILKQLTENEGLKDRLKPNISDESLVFSNNISGIMQGNKDIKKKILSEIEPLLENKQIASLKTVKQSLQGLIHQMKSSKSRQKTTQIISDLEKLDRQIGTFVQKTSAFQYRLNDILQSGKQNDLFDGIRKSLLHEAEKLNRH